MPIDYTNRRGERYYLLQGTTKTGKPKYYVSRKPGGVPVDHMPEGYEFYEHPERGLVSVRRIRSSRVLPHEREQLIQWTRQFAGIEYFRVELEGDSLVVYAPSTDPAEAAAALSRLFAPFADREATEREWIGSHSTYLPMLRFSLLDEQKRLFTAERWCFLGAIDGWINLSFSQPLRALAKKYLPHLNKESFFDLI